MDKRTQTAVPDQERALDAALERVQADWQQAEVPPVRLPARSGLRRYLWVRAALTTALFLIVVTFSLQNEEWAASSEISVLFELLVASYVLTVVSAVGLWLRRAEKLLLIGQVVWDLIFTSCWVYATGASGSLFVFLFLLVIIETSILLDVPATLMTTFMAGFVYWLFIHLEFNGLLSPNPTPMAVPVVTGKGGYPFTPLIFNLSAMVITVGLLIFLKKRLQRTDTLLTEKTESIRDLIRLNESIVRCIRSGIISLDQDLKITSFNEAAKLLTGFEGKDCVGKCVEAFLGAVPLHKLIQEDAEAAVPFRWEQSFVRKDGQELTLGFSGAVLRNDRGEPFGYLMVFQNLTPYKRMEEELRVAERLASLGKLSAGLAHEIRNPLASLYGSIQLLSAELSLTGSQQKLMRIILKESERLNGLITDFLQFASPHDHPKEAVSVMEVLEEVLTLFRQGPHFREAIAIKTHIKPGLKIYANPKQLLQIFWNLLLNAVQAIPGEVGEIRILGTETEHAGGVRFVTLDVQDTGRGIPAEHLTRVFDPFFTSRDEGTGLGLAIVYRIVESYGGKIRATSQEGRGSSIKIELPCEPMGAKSPGGGGADAGCPPLFADQEASAEIGEAE